MLTAASDLARESLKTGDVQAALKQLQEAVRTSPSDANLRVFLFQLLCVVGSWERALTQLNVLSDLDTATVNLAHMYREAIRCEMLRAKVFKGEKAPLVLGEPDQWLALLIESVLTRARGDDAQANELHDRAFSEAPTSPGTINGEAFEWIADADQRLGPVCEAIVNGRYYWIPFSNIEAITVAAPVDLRDLVWLPVRLRLENGGEFVALIPARYPGSEACEDAQIALGRKTIWIPDRGQTTGLGQRLWATDAGEYSLLDVRDLTIHSPTSGVGTSAA
jgi:type VI secretion system protein ImpE